jgi:hypothetical protein
MCDLAIELFPKLNPRRFFQLDCRARLDTTDKAIGQAELQKEVTLTLGMAVTTGIIRSVGLNGPGLSTPVTLIESPVAGSVFWTADEPTPDPQVLEISPHQAYAVTDVAAVTEPIGTPAVSTPLLTAQTNTTYDAPWSFWMPVTLMRSGLLRGYRYGLYSTGLSTHGNMAVQLWTNGNGEPSAAIDGTQATSAHTGLVDAVDMTLDAATCPSGFHYLAAGRYWLCVTIDQNVGASINPPTIEWRTGTVVAKANIYRWSYGLAGSFGFNATWPGLTGGNPAIATATYPSVYALVE